MMSLAMRLSIASFLVLGLAACGENVVAEPITGQSDSGSDTKVDPHEGCTAPEPALACKETHECGNYPQTVCGQSGFCECPSASADAGAHTTHDAGGPTASCTAPEPALACKETHECGNYPQTVCGQSGFCECPSASTDAGAHTTHDAGGPTASCTAPEPALACKETHECGNYPQTVCGQSGFCECPSTDAGAQTTDDAGGPTASCTAPQPALACQETHECGNYPQTVCGQNGFCVCP
jgi:hypothetical protein